MSRGKEVGKDEDTTWSGQQPTLAEIIIATNNTEHYVAGGTGQSGGGRGKRQRERCVWCGAMLQEGLDARKELREGKLTSARTAAQRAPGQGKGLK